MQRRLHLCTSDNAVGVEIKRGARWAEARHDWPPYWLQRGEVLQAVTVATAAAAATRHHYHRRRRRRRRRRRCDRLLGHLVVDMGEIGEIR